MSSKKSIPSLTPKVKICNYCNPQKFLKFNFTFAKENGNPSSKDAIKLLERLQFLSSKMYAVMIIEYQGDKKNFIEEIPIKKLNLKGGIPREFRDIHPAETNEKYAIFRLYPAGSPPGTANPRIIGMIKNTIFYIFYIDWKGTLYKHGK